MNLIKKLFVVIGVFSSFAVLTSCGSQNSAQFARLKPDSETKGILASSKKPPSKDGDISRSY